MINLDSVKNILHKIGKVKVLVIGDLMLDKYVLGDVDRISPEAPIPIMKVDKTFLVPGGAGNVARNLNSLGVKTNFISIVGQDDSGRKLIKSISKNSNVFANIIVDKNRKTSIKTRYIGNNQQLLRTDQETIQKLPNDIEKKIFLYFSTAIKKSDLVILSDYGKGMFFGGFCQHLIKYSLKLKKRVIVDPKNFDFSVYKGAYCITPNIKEAFNATNIHVNDDLSAEKCGLYIINKNLSKKILLTRGKNGLSVIEKFKATHFPANAEEVYDVSGAGDTVVASFAACIAANIDIQTAAEFANINAGIVVKKSGTASIETKEIYSIFNQRNKPNTENKVFKILNIQKIVLEWKNKGLKVGFTNGCFDILHSGHIESLKHASNNCDKLIVALNSDISIKKIKGKDRPVQDELSRVKIISSLSIVDAVILFNEETPIKLIKKIKPDYLIKGADYRISDIVGSDIIDSWGGKVIRSKLVKNISTSKLISNIKNS